MKPPPGGDCLKSSELSTPTTPLSHAEVRSLLAQAQQGDQLAQERLVNANLRLVHSLVRRFTGYENPEREDLFQAGCIGLIQAIQNFDLSYDVRFSTYAVPLILAEIRRFLRENRTVRITRHGLDLARRAAEAREALENELGRSPTPQEIGERIGAAKEEVIAALDAVAPARSLDEPMPGDESDNLTLLDRIPTDSGDDFESMVDGMALRSVLATLDPTERQVLIWRFVQERRQTEIARHLKVSQAYISRLERRILKRLREKLQR